MTEIARMEDEDAQMLRSLVVGTALDGQCYELAIALARGTGLPLVGLWTPTMRGQNGIPGTWRHAAVRFEDGYWDARGMVSEEMFGRPFEEPSPWDIRDVTEDDLRAVRRVPEPRIETLGKLAQALWPDLPWLPTSFHGRMKGFLTELEALSQKHGVWIRSPYPAAQPMLSLEYPDERACYQARLTVEGMAVRFDRNFLV